MLSAFCTWKMLIFFDKFGINNRRMTEGTAGTALLLPPDLSSLGMMRRPQASKGGGRGLSDSFDKPLEYRLVPLFFYFPIKIHFSE